MDRLREFLDKQHKLFINGRWQKSSSSEKWASMASW